MAETAIQFLERWRQAHVYAELRALEQLDETVAECIGAAAEDGISADDKLCLLGRWAGIGPGCGTGPRSIVIWLASS
jgi:hypothetical protein